MIYQEGIPVETVLSRIMTSAGSDALAVTADSAPQVLQNDILLQQAELCPPSVVPDETVNVVEEPALAEMQSRALAQHATQVIVHEGYHELSNHIASRLGGREGFARFDPCVGQLVPATLGASPSHGLLRYSGGHG